MNVSNTPPNNPYAAPPRLDAHTPAAPSVVAPSAPGLPSFRPPTTLYAAAKILLIIYGIILVISAASSFMQLSLLQEAANGAGQDFDRRANANDIREQMIGITQVVWFIVTSIVCLTLLRRLRWNVDTLGAQGLDSSPGWSIGWFFVPIANLWKPYQATTQTWQASVNPQDWRKPTPPWFFPVWWALWIIGGFADRLASRLPVDDIPQLSFVTSVDIASAALTLFLTGCFLKLLSATTRAQLASHKRLSSEANQQVDQNPWTGAAGNPPAENLAF